MSPDLITQLLGAVAWGLTLGSFPAVYYDAMPTAWALLALAATAQLIGNVIGGELLDAALAAALLVLFTYLWWNSGGGDHTRQRLRRVARAFRRTAPAGSSS